MVIAKRIISGDSRFERKVIGIIKEHLALPEGISVENFPFACSVRVPSN